MKLNPRIKNPAQRASISIARSVGKGPYFARQLRHLRLYVYRFGTLPPNRSGKHHAHPSLLDNEHISIAVRRYLTILADGEITPLKLMKQVNDVIIPNLGLSLGGSTICEDTARRWLRKLGYERRLVTKSAYVDGHERPDVVEYRKKFLKEIQYLETYRTQYEGENLDPISPILYGPGEKRHIAVFQDESIFHVGDLTKRVWVRNGRMPLRKKGQGRAIHVSDFIVEDTGRLCLSPEQIHEQDTLPSEQRLPCYDAREIIYPGKNYDGYWTSEKLLHQLEHVVKIFDYMFPGCTGDFYFDHSTGHEAYAPDALNAREMNVKPGGNQRRMHATTIPMDNPHPELRGQRQEMVFPTNLPADHKYYKFRGEPKGMQVVLEERGLYEHIREMNGRKPVGICENCKMSQKTRDKKAREEAAAKIGTDEDDGQWEDDDGAEDCDVDPVSTSTHCCMTRVLSLQANFRSEKPMIQLFLEAAGHSCYFIPKFHCEFNPIEMYWGWVKRRFRCLADGTFKTGKELLPTLLDSCETRIIRAFFRKSWRYMDAYSKGLNVKQVEFAVKKYTSHRRIPRSIMMNVGILENPN
ncbi:hypothetical protein BDY19DRAFT_928836 [Irpex rosettiformis]|uniref:Uncharacterized protein n=1 Tax=Irpex rosettiformis TaxID=378272 RepID=A0ACB8UDA9_9APHY|nr:hypothetical protein BDY19DRAFT_928836 [Irpex rosettiformis]